jgi:NAD(P)-dependent dehydrogenase (short-subunit alcohol dehydrogenase family)
MAWTAADIPSQNGRLAVITGVGGLGFETGLALARAGCDVVLAGRNPGKGDSAIAKIRDRAPGAAIRFELLDLASLESVKAFATRLQAPRLDILINNAGVMSLPSRRETADGFELQFETNYLGHFALTLRLLPLLLQASAPRVVNLSSLYHRRGAIDFDDLQARRSYRPGRAYGQSKLAMLMFALELDRRAKAAGCDLISNAAHPGYARTELIPNGPGDKGALQVLNRLLQPYVSQSAADGALPTLFAATAPDARGGAYYGPDGFYELKGPPTEAFIAPQARDEDVARRLWATSETLVGLHVDAAFAGGVSTRGPKRS